MNRVPRGFFDDSPHRRAHLSARPHVPDTPSRPSLFRWAQNLLSGRPNSAQVERHERSLVVVDVSYANGNRRNASAREKRRPIPLKPTNTAAGSSRPPNSNVTQQSAQAQLSSQLQATISTASTTPSGQRARRWTTSSWLKTWLYYIYNICGKY